jgi:membrane protease YdiL (CAAX protease family)
MGYIEKKANITFAIIVTSVLFALVHLFNGGMSGVNSSAIGAHIPPKTIISNNISRYSITVSAFVISK